MVETSENNPPKTVPNALLSGAEDGKPPSYILRRPGGEIDRRRIFNVPGAVIGLILFTVAAYFALGFAPRDIGEAIALIAAVSPARFLAGAAVNGGVLSWFSPLVSHIFVHANLTHLVLNCLWLLAFGAPVARRMKTTNSLQSLSAFSRAGIFLSFYVLCGMFGALTYIAMHANDFVYLVGASGAVSGLLGALVRFAFNRSTLFGPDNAAFSPLTSRSVIVWSAVVVFMNIAMGVFGGALAGGATIAWEAHVGGYLFGLLTYPFFERLALSFR